MRGDGLLGEFRKAVDDGGRQQGEVPAPVRPIAEQSRAAARVHHRPADNTVLIVEEHQLSRRLGVGGAQADVVFRHLEFNDRRVSAELGADVDERGLQIGGGEQIGLPAVALRIGNPQQAALAVERDGALGNIGLAGHVDQWAAALLDGDGPFDGGAVFVQRLRDRDLGHLAFGNGELVERRLLQRTKLSEIDIGEVEHLTDGRPGHAHQRHVHRARLDVGERRREALRLGARATRDPHFEPDVLLVDLDALEDPVLAGLLADASEEIVEILAAREQIQVRGAVGVVEIAGRDLALRVGAEIGVFVDRGDVDLPDRRLRGFADEGGQAAELHFGDMRGRFEPRFRDGRLGELRHEVERFGLERKAVVGDRSDPRHGGSRRDARGEIDAERAGDQALVRDAPGLRVGGRIDRDHVDHHLGRRNVDAHHVEWLADRNRYRDIGPVRLVGRKEIGAVRRSGEGRKQRGKQDDGSGEQGAQASTARHRGFPRLEAPSG